MKRGAAAEICARGQAEMCAAGPGSGPPQVPPIAPRRKRGAASNARRAARQLRQQPSGRSKGCVQATPGTAERTLAARRPRGAFTHLSGSAGAQGVRSDRRKRAGGTCTEALQGTSVRMYVHRRPKFVVTENHPAYTGQQRRPRTANADSRVAIRSWSAVRRILCRPMIEGVGNLATADPLDPRRCKYEIKPGPGFVFCFPSKLTVWF